MGCILVFQLAVKGRIDKNEVKKKKQSKTITKPKNLKCFQFHNEGHFKNDCAERKNKRREQNGNASTVEEEEGYKTVGVCVGMCVCVCVLPLRTYKRVSGSLTLIVTFI